MAETQSPAANLCIEVVAQTALSAKRRQVILDLINRAYEEDLSAVFRSLTDGQHVLGRLGDQLVCHAMWVTRRLQIAQGPLLHTAYVELVATDAPFRRRGYAAAVMRRLQHEIRDFEIAALSPFSAHYYARLGWELWRGPLFVREGDTTTPSPEDEEVMILRLPKTPSLDLTAPLSIEWREGEVW